MLSDAPQRKSSVSRLLLVLTLALTAGFGFVSWKAWGYRGECYRREKLLQEERNRIVQKGIDLGIRRTKRTIDPLSTRPFLIFTEPEVSWDALAPNLALDYGNVEKKILATFPVPGAYSGSDLAEVDCDERAIRFPGPGEYYLHTTIGFFKVLILDSATPDDEKILAVAALVSKNCVHAMAHARKIQPNVAYYRYHRPDHLLADFFSTDQPLKFHCGYAVEFLCLLLRNAGYRVQRVQLFTEGQKKGHIVAHAFFPDQNSFGMIDPDYGAIVLDEQGTVLSVAEIAVRVRKQPDGLRVKDIGQKHWLKSIFNTAHPVDFAWSPAKHSDIRCVQPEEYLKILEDYTAEYWLVDYDENNAWKPRQEFLWDGREVGR